MSTSTFEFEEQERKQERWKKLTTSIYERERLCKEEILSKKNNLHIDDEKEKEFNEKEKDFSEKESGYGPEIYIQPSTDLNVKKRSFKKETSSTFFNKETNNNSSFLSNNETKQNKRIDSLKNSGNNFKRSIFYLDPTLGKNNNNIFPKNLTTNKYANLFYKNTDNSSFRAGNIPIQNSFNNKQNLSSSKNLFSEKLNLTNNAESDINLNFLSKIKSSTTLLNLNRRSISISNNLLKVNDNNTNSNYPGFILSETHIGENQNEDINNNSTIRDGKSLFLNLKKLYDYKEIERSKSPRLINHNNISNLSTNKGVLKNIETNVFFHKLNYFIKFKK